MKHNSGLLFMIYLQPQTKIKVFMLLSVHDFTKIFDRVPHALLMDKLFKTETIDKYLL